MEIEFVVDEKPQGSALQLRDAIVMAVQREYELRQSIGDKELSKRQELLRVGDFL